MNKEEFLDLAKNNGARKPYKIRSSDEFNYDDFIFMVSWVSGGVTGRSCWGTESRSVDGDAPIDDIADLDKFLGVVKPDILFLQYKAIVSRCMKSGTFDDRGDYYGNFSQYSYKAVSANKLFGEMSAMFPDEFIVEDNLKQKKLKP